MRIAILILAHKNPAQLQRLINHFNKDFSVYVHADRKMNFQTSGEDAQIISNYSVSWGSYKQILATRDLFSLAHKDRYDRYLLISGQDLPLKSNRYLISFFEENPHNYIEYRKLPSADGWGGGPGVKRMSLYWFDESRDKSSFRRKLKKKFQKLLHKIQKRLFLYRKLPENLYGGANWMDLNQQAMDVITSHIEQNPSCLERYRNTRCADEIFFQSVLLNTPEKLSLVNRSLRYIDMETGPEHPRILRINDLAELRSSNQLFARKFDEEIDNEVIDAIYDSLDAPAVSADVNPQVFAAE